MHITKTFLELLKPKVLLCNFNFKFPVDCDAMMHVLQDSINLKYSELLTKVISKCNLIWKLIILEETSFNISCTKLPRFILLLSHCQLMKPTLVNRIYLLGEIENSS